MPDYIPQETGELCTIEIDAIEWHGDDWSDEVTPLRDNRRMPIIVRETETGWFIQDGYGRTCGMRNAGRESIRCIVVSDEDIAARGNAAGDDPEWVRAMHRKYAADVSDMCEWHLGDDE